MHDDEEERHSSEHHERGGVGEVEGCDDDISKPGGSLRGEECTAKRDADAEEYNGAPVDFVDDLLPLHNADFWQHQKRNGYHGRSRGIQNVQLFFCCPEK